MLTCECNPMKVDKAKDHVKTLKKQPLMIATLDLLSKTISSWLFDVAKVRNTFRESTSDKGMYT